MKQIDPARIDRAVDAIMVALKRVFHDQLQSANGVTQQFAVICTVDPRNGKPFDTDLNAVIIIPAKFETEADKDQIAMAVRAIGVAGEAVASIVCFDTWIATGKAAEDHMRTGIMPRDHPDRQEAMFVGIERRGRPPQLEHHVYKTLDDGIVFEDSQRMPPTTKIGGRFAELLAPEQPPAEVVKMMQTFVAMGAFGQLQWTAV